MEPLVSTHTLLGRSQKRALRAFAAETETSMAALLREAVDHYLRVVAGPSAHRVRRDARDVVGVLPLESGGGLDPADDAVAWSPPAD